MHFLFIFYYRLQKYVNCILSFEKIYKSCIQNIPIFKKNIRMIIYNFSEDI